MTEGKGIRRLLTPTEKEEVLMRPRIYQPPQVGERFRVRPVCLKNSAAVTPLVTATVVWVHPKGRFALLEYQGKLGTNRECFHPMELTDEKRVKGRRGTWT